MVAGMVMVYELLVVTVPSNIFPVAVPSVRWGEEEVDAGAGAAGAVVHGKVERLRGGRVVVVPAYR